MKLIVSNELKSRISNAAENGSVIAGDLLKELNGNGDVSETIRGVANYFSTKKVKTTKSDYVALKIKFTVCNKDLKHDRFPDKNNPQAPWYSENRTTVEPSTFVEYFKNLRTYTSEEMNYFISAIALDSKVTVKAYSQMRDFEEAYNFNNYSPISENDEYISLHSSCMRHEDTARNCADFYYHFAGARIVVAKDRNGYVVGRAILWDNVSSDTYEKLSVLDRIYFSHHFIKDKIIDYAKNIGVDLRKTYNDYTHKTEFTALKKSEYFEEGQILEDLVLTANLKASKWHKKGVPYLDTFTYLHLNNQKFILCNQTGANYIASLKAEFADKNIFGYK